MKFEAIDIKGDTIFNTTQKSCIPDKPQIESMCSVGYKFKIDGKIISKKKLLEFLSHNKE